MWGGTFIHGPILEAHQPDVQNLNILRRRPGSRLPTSKQRIIRHKNTSRSVTGTDSAEHREDVVVARRDDRDVRPRSAGHPAARRQRAGLPPGLLRLLVPQDGLLPPAVMSQRPHGLPPRHRREDGSEGIDVNYGRRLY